MCKTNILELDNVSKQYSTTKFALSNVSFAVPQGFITGFIGPNGAGKTTTIRIILDLLSKDSGSITKMQTSEIGVVLDAPMFPGAFTCLEVEQASKMFYPTWDSEKFHHYLELWNIELTKKIEELSRGMGVKLQIASALARDTKLLILDEPTSGLDPVSRDEICALLLEVIGDPERAVLFSTHITSDLEKVADYIVFIIDGKILFAGTKDALLEKYLVVKGAQEDLVALTQSAQLIGVREYEYGFEALIDVDSITTISKHLQIEKASLDEIIVFNERQNKTAKQGE
jgi:ABC-2 type transport system ATP-binding protein